MTDENLHCFARFCLANWQWWADDPALLRRVFEAYAQDPGPDRQEDMIRA